MENSEENQELEETLVQAGLRKGYFTLIEGVYDPGILKAITKILHLNQSH